MLERIGLFVVIVIGEAGYLSVTGLAGHPTIGGVASVVFGFVSCALLARAFFRWATRITESGIGAARSARSYGAMRDVVMYFPFITVLALTLIAASIGIAVAKAGIPMAGEARWLLATGVAGFYLSNALIGLRLVRRPGRVALLFSVGAILAAIAGLLTGGFRPGRRWAS